MEDIAAVEKIVSDDTQDNPVTDYAPPTVNGKPPQKEPTWKPALQIIDESMDFDYEAPGFAFQGPSLSDDEAPVNDPEYIDEPSAVSDDPYAEDLSFDLIYKGSKKAKPVLAPPSAAVTAAPTVTGRKGHVNGK